MPESSRLTAVSVSIVAVALIALVILVIVVGRDPVVQSMEPTIVSAGETVTLSGSFFGASIGTVSFAGRRLPTSNITSWSPDEIAFVVPRAATSGLVYVLTDRGRSEGRLLQVRESIPRTSFSGEGPGAPLITDISTTELTIGAMITLSGENFGSKRRTSRVVFSMEGGAPCPLCDDEVSYGVWSDRSISVRVPSGAASGFLSVVAPWGASNPIRVVIERPAGRLLAENPLEIALRYGASLDRVTLRAGDDERMTPGERDIVLRLPTVSHSVAQRGVRYLDDEPDQLRFEFVDASFEHEVVRTVVVDRYAVRSLVDPAAVSAAYEAESGFFDHYTRSLPDVPSDDEALLTVAQRLRSGRASPYRIAEAAYAYTLDSLVYALGREDRSALAGLQTGYGDDFTYATLFVALLRAARVPARTVGGLLVTGDGHAYAHFWAEFFVTGIGWIPVDPALGDGAFPAGFPVPEDPRDYYFANLDNSRVAFQHGFDETEPTFLDGVRISPRDPYTLQRSYAQAGGELESFRLSWHNPRVIGRFYSD